MKQRHPGIPRLAAKLDVARAFKWHEVECGDVEEFGTSFPGAQVGVEGDVIVVHCAVTFGWNGGPGEYMIFAWGAKTLHGTYLPPAPSWHDTYC